MLSCTNLPPTRWCNYLSISGESGLLEVKLILILLRGSMSFIFKKRSVYLEEGGAESSGQHGIATFTAHHWSVGNKKIEFSYAQRNRWNTDWTRHWFMLEFPSWALIPQGSDILLLHHLEIVAFIQFWSLTKTRISRKILPASHKLPWSWLVETWWKNFLLLAFALRS